MTKIFSSFFATLSLLGFIAISFVNLPTNAQSTPGTIVDIAISAPNFKTLVAALKAADLVDTLKGTGPFTVLAPTDDAFAKVPKSTLDALLKPENKDNLKKVLLYHVISGNFKADQVKTLTSAKTVQGGDIKIKTTGNNIVLNDSANVIQADIAASNGTIHAIDNVLIPADLKLVESPVLTSTTRTGGFDVQVIYGIVIIAVLGYVSVLTLATKAD